MELKNESHFAQPFSNLFIMTVHGHELKKKSRATVDWEIK
jgi:hypothetical protein